MALLLLRLQHDRVRWTKLFYSIFFWVILAGSGFPNLIKIPNKPILLPSNFLRWHTKLLVKHRKHVLVIETIIILKHFHQNRQDVFLHDSWVKPVLTPRVPHQRSQEHQIPVTEVDAVPLMLQHGNIALPFRILSILRARLRLRKLNPLISSMNKAAIDIHQNQNFGVLFGNKSFHLVMKFLQKCWIFFVGLFATQKLYERGDHGIFRITVLYKCEELIFQVFVILPLKNLNQ